MACTVVHLFAVLSENVPAINCLHENAHDIMEDCFMETFPWEMDMEELSDSEHCQYADNSFLRGGQLL